MKNEIISVFLYIFALDQHNNPLLALVTTQVVPIFMHNNDRLSYDTISSINGSQTSLGPGFLVILNDFFLLGILSFSTYMRQPNI